MKPTFVYVLLVFSVVITITRSISHRSLEVSETLDVLYKSGYYVKTANHTRATLDGRSELSAIKSFQKFYGLPQTGRLDNATAALLRERRSRSCGVPDVPDNGRMGFFGVTPDARLQQIWQTRDVTYTINAYPPRFSHSAVEKEVARAFQSWSDVANVKFIKVNDEYADIRVSFHGTEDDFENPHLQGFSRDEGFDGPFGTLAHAWFPTDGRLHFDKEEPWSSDPSMFYLIV